MSELQHWVALNRWTSMERFEELSRGLLRVWEGAKDVRSDVYKAGIEADGSRSGMERRVDRVYTG